MKKRLLAAALWAGLATCSAHGAPPEPAPAAATAVVARIDGAPLYAFTVDVMLRRARQSEPASTAADVTERLIANRLLARQARATLGDAELNAAGRVGFAPDVAQDEQLTAILLTQYRKEIDAAVLALPGASVEASIAQTQRPAPDNLDKIFGERRKVTLEFALGPEQTLLAKRVVLLRSKDGAAHDISLYDAYRRQNVQGRLEFHSRNLDFIEQQARLALRSAFLLAWAERHFGADALRDLRGALADQEAAHALMEAYGLAPHSEGLSKLQVRLAAQVTPAEIARYYQAHRDQFKMTVKVKARHIRVASEAAAKQVIAAAAGGADFALLARRHSLAPDAAAGGELGWIGAGASLDWLAGLAFLQAEGEVSKPFRAAVGDKEVATWEVVLTEKRVEGFQPADSETVRYGARTAIAADKAARQFQALRERLLAGAKIERVAAARAAALP